MTESGKADGVSYTVGYFYSSVSYTGAPVIAKNDDGEWKVVDSGTFSSRSSVLSIHWPVR